MICVQKIIALISSIDVVNINLDSKPSWFLRKNPLGLVPAIQNKEFVAYESDIVVDYLVRILRFIFLVNIYLAKYYFFYVSGVQVPRASPAARVSRRQGQGRLFPTSVQQKDGMNYII